MLPRVGAIFAVIQKPPISSKRVENGVEDKTDVFILISLFGVCCHGIDIFS